MSINGAVFTNLIDQKLLNLHTGFFAKVLSINGDMLEERTAKVQPLNMVKPVGGEAQKQAVMTIPVLRTAQKFKKRNVTVNNSTFSVVEPCGIEKGDTVYCLCAERDITETKKGKFAIPPLGHHKISDAVVIGVI